MSYDNWRKRLEIAEQHKTVAARRAAVAALKINFSQPGEADEGYYRKPITKKHPTNGQNEIIGWIPVAYYMVKDAYGPPFLGASIGTPGDHRELDEEEAADEELWSWVVSNPIPYDWYSAVADHGDAWPDADEAIAKQRLAEIAANPDSLVSGKALGAALERIIASDHNKPPELLPHVEHGNAIDNAIGAGKDLPVTTVAEAALVAGAANLLRDRRLAAEKIAKLKVEPLKLAYEAERGNWLPMVKRAKDVEDGWRQKVNLFEAAERRRIAAETLAAMEKQREQDEANARAADRAIANAEPEPPPVVEEVVIPQAPQPIQPTYGDYRPAAKPLKKFAVIGDDRKVYEFFRNEVELIVLLQKLATNAVRQGIEVPGTTIREGTE